MPNLLTADCMYSLTNLQALVVARSNNVQLHDLSFKDNPHMHVVFHHCDGVKISHISIDAPEDSPNTDGIHLKETASVIIEHCTIGTGISLLQDHILAPKSKS